MSSGVVNQQSRRSNRVNWREVNLMRWDDQTLTPVGGWEKHKFDSFASPLRAAFRWSDNNDVQRVAYLCERHCYVETSGLFEEITPADGLNTSSTIGVGGYGDSLYGTDVFGEPRDSVDRLNVAVPTFTLNNWGEELLVMSSPDGRLLRWNPSEVATVLTAVTNAPVGNTSFTVVPERHVILFGSGGTSQKFEWSDQEDNTDWTPSTTSKSGSFFVEPSSPILAHQNVSGGVLFFTDKLSYLIQYIGLPYVFSYSALTEGAPPYSPASIAGVPEGAFWAALDGFWMFDGVSVQPVSCPIWDWIEERINKAQSRYKSVMLSIKPKSELWWFFVGGDGNSENNYLVIFNYKTSNWSMGNFGRSCGVSSPNDPNPVLGIGTSLYKHESGFLYDGAASRPWAETFTLNINRGTSIATIMRMLPEMIGDKSTVQYRFIKRNNPTSGPEVESSAKLIKDNGYVDVRETARDMRLRIEMVGSSDWSHGPIDLEVIQRGTK